MKKQTKPYHPPQKLLERYAHVLINFALNSGKGITKGDVVRIIAPESAKLLFAELKKAVYRSGGHVIATYLPDDIGFDKYNINMTRDFYENAAMEQLDFFPTKYMKGLADTIDHQVYIIAEANKKALDGIDPKKIMRSGLAVKPYREWLNKKENEGKFTWTLGLYGTPDMAREAGLSEKAYWNEIIKACFLDKPDPVAEWKELYKELDAYLKRLNTLTKKTVKWHVKGKDVDLWIGAGNKRRFMGGSGRNIPSFELFTSPHCRETEGWIKFSEPLYRYGNIITGIELTFENGHVVKSKANKNEKVLQEMIATENADMVGEFSMTDRRFSRITKFMAETLYDENVGGRFGNTHIALGNAYHDCYDGDPARVTKAQWKKLGFNNSSVHTDIVSTIDRTVTAYFKDGTTQVIYKDGMYQF